MSRALCCAEIRHSSLATCHFSRFMAVSNCVYGSVPRAVASVPHSDSRSLPLAVLIQRVFPYTKLITTLVDYFICALKS